MSPHCNTYPHYFELVIQFKLIYYFGAGRTAQLSEPGLPAPGLRYAGLQRAWASYTLHSHHMCKRRHYAFHFMTHDLQMGIL